MRQKFVLFLLVVFIFAIGCGNNEPKRCSKDIDENGNYISCMREIKIKEKDGIIEMAGIKDEIIEKILDREIKNRSYYILPGEIVEQISNRHDFLWHHFKEDYINSGSDKIFYDKNGMKLVFNKNGISLINGLCSIDFLPTEQFDNLNKFTWNKEFLPYSFTVTAGLAIINNETGDGKILLLEKAKNGPSFITKMDAKLKNKQLESSISDSPIYIIEKDKEHKIGKTKKISNDKYYMKIKGNKLYELFNEAKSISNPTNTEIQQMINKIKEEMIKIKFVCPEDRLKEIEQIIGSM